MQTMLHQSEDIHVDIYAANGGTIGSWDKGTFTLYSDETGFVAVFEGSEEEKHTPSMAATVAKVVAKEAFIWGKAIASALLFRGGSNAARAASARDAHMELMRTDGRDLEALRHSTFLEEGAIRLHFTAECAKMHYISLDKKKSPFFLAINTDEGDKRRFYFHPSEVLGSDEEKRAAAHRELIVWKNLIGCQDSPF